MRNSSMLRAFIELLEIAIQTVVSRKICSTTVSLPDVSPVASSVSCCSKSSDSVALEFVFTVMYRVLTIISES